MSNINPSYNPYMMGGAVLLGPGQSAQNLVQANDRFTNIVTSGGPGIVPEHVFGIPIPFAHELNKAAGDLGSRLQGWPKGQNAINTYYASGMMGGIGMTPNTAQFGAMPFGAGQFGASQFGATLPGPAGFFGDFGGQSEAALSLAGPRLAQKEQLLGGLRTQIAAGAELTQTQMLQYQELSSAANQLFMWAQNIMTSENEKIKGWAQALGRI